MEEKDFFKSLYIGIQEIVKFFKVESFILTYITFSSDQLLTLLVANIKIRKNTICFSVCRVQKIKLIFVAFKLSKV